MTSTSYLSDTTGQQRGRRACITGQSAPPPPRLPPPGVPSELISRSWAHQQEEGYLQLASTDTELTQDSDAEDDDPLTDLEMGENLEGGIEVGEGTEGGDQDGMS